MDANGMRSTRTSSPSPAWTRTSSPARSLPQLLEVFRVFDRDGNRYISAAELARSMTRMGQPLSFVELTEIINCAQGTSVFRINPMSCSSEERPMEKCFLPLPVMAKCSLLVSMVLFFFFFFFFLLFLITKEWIPPSSQPSFSPQTLNVTPPSDRDAEVEFDFTPFVRVYKSGRVERLHGTATVPAGLDPSTGVASRDVAIDPATGLSARLFLPADLVPGGGGGGKRVPIVVYFHGGAFVIESAFSPFYHNYLNALASRARALAVSVEYRLAPEHPLPAAYADAWAALQWAAAGGGGDPWLAARGDPARVFLAGDSAGANIAHNAAARAGKVRVEGLVLQNPYFWGKEAVGREPRERWIREGMERSWGFVCAGAMGIDDPAVNPMGSLGLGLGMRRALVTVAGRDMLRERGVAYAEGLRGSEWGRVEVELYEAEDQPHVYFLSNPRSPAAAKEIHVVASFIHRR